ncbi:MAG: PAS domain S-box protein [Candidatus Delongbacteria bacterium]|nr:PAS domain S-box protein [Candidatus Delongbacteria bacterium]
MIKPDSQIAKLQAEIERLQGEVIRFQQSEARLREMGNNIALGLYRRTCGAQGTIVNVNPALAKLFGYLHPEELEGMSMRDLYWDPEECDQFSGEVFEHGDVSRRELRMRHRDGSTRWITVTTTMILDTEGEAEFFDGIMEDITARKAAEAETARQREQLIQADKMVALGTLVSGVAHEINNPNQFIVSHISPLKKIWDDVQPILDRYFEHNGDFLVGGGKYSLRREQVPEMFASVLKGAQRIRHIVRELRDYTRQQPLAMDNNLELNAVVKSALELLANQIGKSTTNFSVNYAEGLPQITGDYQRIEQVVINLVQNACQALDDNSAAVVVSTLLDPAERSVLLQVRDEGIGIPAEDLPRIRDPFFTTRRESGGTGLGLSISETIIKKHGGTLHFASQVGVGTTVTITFPVNTIVFPS